jgi:hypothetical protein
MDITQAITYARTHIDGYLATDMGQRQFRDQTGLRATQNARTERSPNRRQRESRSAHRALVEPWRSELP